MKLVLLRHGETTWNAARRLQGTADSPLSVRGRWQVEALADAFAFPDLVIRSPLQRAAESAALLGFEHADVDDRWTELDLGTWTGKLIDELPADEVDQWRQGTFVPPGGEGFTDAVARVGDAIADIDRRGFGCALVITHGGAIRAAVTAVTGLSRSQLAPVGPGTFSELDVSRRRLVTYGCGMVVHPGHSTADVM